MVILLIKSSISSPTATKQFILPLILKESQTKVDSQIFCLYLCVAGTKPLHCFSVHHWVVNTVQRSPFFRNIILSVGEWNFAIWREEVMVTTLVAAKTPARVRDYWPDAVFFYSAPPSGGSHHPVCTLWPNLLCGMLVPDQTCCFLRWESGRQRRGVEPAGKDKWACARPGARQQSQDHLYEAVHAFM